MIRPSVSILFASGHAHGFAALRGLIESPASVSGEITISAIIGNESQRTHGSVGRISFKDLARKECIPYIATSDGTLRSCASDIVDINPDYTFIVGWNHLIPPDVLTHFSTTCSADGIFQSGAIGMHPAPLPVGRGQAPIPWSIIKGFRRTALSAFFIEAGADSGPLIAQHWIDMDPDVTSTELFRIFERLHFEMAQYLAPALARRTVPGNPQVGPSVVWGKRRPEDGLIDLTETYESIDRLVRALREPYPPAFIQLRDIAFPIAAVRYLKPRTGWDPPTEGQTSIIATCADALIELIKQ